MEKVKLSTLSKDTIVLVGGYDNTSTVSDILDDLEYYKNKEVYTVTEYHASFNAEDILDNAIDYECENNMYEDWDESIKSYIKEEDITDLQKILDKILARGSSSNVAYNSDKLIEIDI